MTKELRELRTERPIGKSWYAFQEFVKHCIAGDKIVYLHPDFKLLSPKLHEVEIIEAERRMKTKCIETVWKYNCSEDRIASLIEENINKL